MTNVGNLLVGVMNATEKEVQQKEIEKGRGVGLVPPGQDIKLLLTRWDEFVSYLIRVGGARSDAELRNVTLFDFMQWLKGIHV